MARRSKSKDGLDGLFWLLCQLPWWVTLIAGAGIYVYQSRLEEPLQFSVEKPAVIWYGLLLLQWFCLGASVISAIKAFGRRMLFKAAKDIDAIRAMSWREFESLVGEFYRRQGYRVEDTGGGGADGGVDLLLRRDGEKVLVQCKQWRTFKVGVSIVREMYGVMVAEHADRVIVVTSGRYTNDAIQFARGKPMDLVDGAALARMIREVQNASAAHSPGTAPSCRCRMGQGMGTIRLPSARFAVRPWSGERPNAVLTPGTPSGDASDFPIAAASAMNRFVP